MMPFAQGKPIALISREEYELLLHWVRPKDVPRVKKAKKT